MFVTFFFQSDIIFHQLFLIYLSAKIMGLSTNTCKHIHTPYGNAEPIEKLGQFQNIALQTNWKFWAQLAFSESPKQMSNDTDFFNKTFALLYQEASSLNPWQKKYEAEHAEDEISKYCGRQRLIQMKAETAHTNTEI